MSGPLRDAPLDQLDVDLGLRRGSRLRLLAVSAWFLLRSRVRVGLEGRLGLIVEADIPMATLGATIGGDALTW